MEGLRTLLTDVVREARPLPGRGTRPPSPEELNEPSSLNCGADECASVLDAEEPLGEPPVARRGSQGPVLSQELPLVLINKAASCAKVNFTSTFLDASSEADALDAVQAKLASMLRPSKESVVSVSSVGSARSLRSMGSAASAADRSARRMLAELGEPERKGLSNRPGVYRVLGLTAAGSRVSSQLYHAGQSRTEVSLKETRRQSARMASIITMDSGMTNSPAPITPPLEPRSPRSSRLSKRSEDGQTKPGPTSDKEVRRVLRHVTHNLTNMPLRKDQA